MSDLENRSFFCEKCTIWKIAHFLLIFALSLFLKEPKSNYTFHCSFWKSEWVIALFAALWKRANERPLFSALFAKEQIRDCSFFALFKRATKRAIAPLVFQKERQKELWFFPSFMKSDCSFTLSKKAEEQKRAKNELFSKLLIFAQKKSYCSFSKWTNAQPCSCKVGQLLICSFAHHSFRSFQKSDWAIARSFTLLKKANERLLFSSLFAKEGMSNRSFWHSLQKSKWAIALFLLVSKERPKERLLFQKEQQKELSLFCSLKKSNQKSDHSFALSNRAKMSTKW